VVNHTPSRTGTITTISGTELSATAKVTVSKGTIHDLKTDFYNAYGYLVCRITGRTSEVSTVQLVTEVTFAGTPYKLAFNTSLNTASANTTANSFNFTNNAWSGDFDYLIIMGSNCNQMLSPFL
jgi:hypothetical protein